MVASSNSRRTASQRRSWGILFKPVERSDTMSAPLTRRQVLQTASALGVSALLMEQVAGDDRPLIAQSGLVTKQMKTLKYEELPGLLTKAQITPHYQAHYGGALKRFVALDQQIDKLLGGKEPLGGDAYTHMQK